MTRIRNYLFDEGTLTIHGGGGGWRLTIARSDRQVVEIADPTEHDADVRLLEGAIRGDRSAARALFLKDWPQTHEGD